MRSRVRPPGSAPSPTPIGRGKARYKLDQERGPQNHSERTSLETPGDTRWDLDTSKPSEASWWSQLCRCHSDRPSDGINGCEKKKNLKSALASLNLRQSSRGGCLLGLRLETASCLVFATASTPVNDRSAEPRRTHPAMGPQPPKHKCDVPSGVDVSVLRDPS